MIKGKDLKDYVPEEPLNGQFTIQCTGVKFTKNGDSLFMENVITEAPDNYEATVLGTPINDFLRFNWDSLDPNKNTDWIEPRDKKRLFSALEAYEVDHDGLEFDEQDFLSAVANVVIKTGKDRDGLPEIKIRGYLHA